MLSGLTFADDPTKQVHDDAVDFSRCHGAWVAGLEMIENEDGVENTRKRMESEKVHFHAAAYIASSFAGKEDPWKYVDKVSEDTKIIILSEYEIYQKSGMPMNEFGEIAEKCVGFKAKAAYFYEEFMVKDCLSSDSCFSDLQ